MERRDFLKSLGIVGASVLAPVSSSRTQEEPDAWIDEYVFPQPSRPNSVVVMYLDLLEGYEHDVLLRFEGNTQVFGLRTYVDPHEVIAKSCKVNELSLWVAAVDLASFNTDCCWCPIDFPVGPIQMRLKAHKDVVTPFVFLVSPIKTLEEQMKERGMKPFEFDMKTGKLKA